MTSGKKHCPRCGTEMVEKHNSLNNLFLISSATYTLPEPIVNNELEKGKTEVYEIFWECPRCHYVLTR